MKFLVINPGSTSTKIALFQNDCTYECGNKEEEPVRRFDDTI